MKSDDDEVLYDFVTSRYPSLRRSAFLMCGDWAAAEDHTQAVLARLVSGTQRGTVDDPDAQVYADLMASYQHRPARREHVFVAAPRVDDAPEGAGSEPSDEAVRQPAPGAAADDGEAPAGDPIRTVLVLDALHKLSPRCRAVLVLRHWDGFAVDETADMLGLGDARVEAYEAAGLSALEHLLTETATPSTDKTETPAGAR
jgi:DNA-directed RNA polymerase specialized sigma24 family protein